MKTIVLGYDDTVPAKNALERTAELAAAFEANVVVVSVAPVLAPAARSGSFSGCPAKASAARFSGKRTAPS
jgi:nucleotide-binding universal stress UspA family protein